MKRSISAISARAGVARALSVAVVSLLSGLFPSRATSAPPETPTQTQPAAAPSATTQPSVEEVAKRNAWRKKMLQTPRPKKGCFAATYPQTEWREVPCQTPPHLLRALAG
jgi:hypothetical protein